MSQDDDEITRDAVRAFAEEVAAVHFMELTARHSHKSCVERDCGLCHELRVVKAETIPVVRDLVVDRVYDALVRTAALMDPQINSIDDLVRKMKLELGAIRTLSPHDLWA